MALVWFLSAIAITALIPGLLLVRAGFKERRKGGYLNDGVGFFLFAGLVLLIPLGIALTISGTAVGRSLSKTQCEKKAEATGGRYEWFDYHFFGYECQLRTPSGNITGTPVWPIENVTEGQS